jgi:hypothetical protein
MKHQLKEIFARFQYTKHNEDFENKMENIIFYDRNYSSYHLYCQF